jgi:hypothetical protein
MLPQEDPETEYDQSLFTNAEWIDVKTGCDHDRCR